jgi:hypothetical protein
MPLFLLICTDKYVLKYITYAAARNTNAIAVLAGLAVGVAFVVLFSYFSANTILQYQVNYNNAIVTMKRSGCYGTCPIYSLTIFGNGTVVYEGHRYVAIARIQTSTISKQEVRELVDHFYNIGYFSMENEYTGNVGDIPTATTSIRVGERFKLVADTHGAPDRLKQLEDRIDNIADSDRWVKCLEGQEVASVDAGGCRDAVLVSQFPRQ